MAENESTITTVFRADISNFSAATQQLNRNVAQINSEFNNATASMGKWNNNTDGLKAKLTQLNGVLTQETNRLQLMEAQYAELVKQGKENTTEAQNLATAINNQSAKVKECEKNIDYYSASLKELTDAGVSTKAELDQVNKAMQEQARIAKDEAAAAAKAAAEETEKLNQKQQELKDNAKELGGGILKGAAIGVAGVAAACAGALGSMNNLVNETKELRTQMGQLETSFTTAGLSADDAKKTYSELNGVLGDSGKATEASLHLAQLAKNEQELSSYTNILTGVYATFGDSLPVEGLAEAMNHTAELGTVQGNLADALEWAGVNVDDFNAQLSTLNTEEERAQLINTTLNGIYGESAEKYKEVNKDVIEANKVQDEYNQTMAGLAEEVQPAMNSFKLAMVNILKTVFDKFKEVDLEGLIKKITEAITTVVNVALPPLMKALSWVLDNLNWLAPLLGTVVGLIGGISAAIKIYNTVVTIARTVQMAWNLALSANPIGLVVIAITGLVAAFVLLWNKCEGFRNFFIGMWNAIKTAGKAAADFLSKTFTSIVNTIKGVINGVISIINGAIKAINKISVKVPDWVPEFGGKKFGFNLKTIPKLATGGVVDKPTLAMVGEAGKEAVMPLENNTGWIDQLANKLSGKMGNQSITNNFYNTFEKMETSRLALHQANLEAKRILGGN